VGSDVAKHTFEIATLRANGKYRTRSKLANNRGGVAQLGEWLEKHPGPEPLRVMEGTGLDREAPARWLVSRRYRLRLVNPGQTAASPKTQPWRAKDDRKDAQLIAGFGQHQLDKGRLRPWQPEPPVQKRLRALVRRLADLREMEQMERNRLESADA